MKTLSYYKSLKYTPVVEEKEFDSEKWFSAYYEEIGDAPLHGIGNTEEEAIKSLEKEKDAYLQLLWDYDVLDTLPKPKQQNC